MASTLADDLLGAAERGEIVARYQPQIDLESRQVCSVEALARWQHPERGMIPPIQFIPLAEDTGVIHDIGRMMLATACRQAALWKAQGMDLGVAVNFSATELSNDEFCTDVLDTLAHEGADPRQVTLEVTETRPVTDPAQLVDCLQGARDAGLRLAIDDFGSGYSSLHRMYRLHATELKLDGYLIRRGVTDEVRDVVDAAHHEGARVVAEGVETLEHLQTAIDLGCDRAQGFLIAGPVPAAHIQAIYRHRRTRPIGA